METKDYLYLVKHLHTENGYKHILRYIGAYPTLEKAEDALDKSKELPQFKDNLDGFFITKKVVFSDKD